MKSKLLLLSFFLLTTFFAHAQDSTGVQKKKHLPIGLTTEMPSIYLMNFNSINASDSLLGHPNNFAFMYGVHLYMGNRDKFFVSVGIAAGNNKEKGSLTTIAKNRKFDFVMYKPIYEKKRSTIFAMAGITDSKATLNVWKNEPLNPTIPVQYKIQQNWSLNLGMMFDFFKSDIGSNYVSMAIKVGYNIPLAKAQWYSGESKIDNAPQINLGGPYLSFVINTF